MNNQGSVAQSLVALYKAMGGGWLAGRGRPLLDDATRETMGERGDWRELLQEPLPAPDTGPQLIRPGGPKSHE
ncbi:hypothetical protein [Accumulibacter sp.]|uniref:hypothetical protein n=1 Tax=Accumulibacter sp. TaxID=2053492 RepID=UPI00338DB60B